MLSFVKWAHSHCCAYFQPRSLKLLQWRGAEMTKKGNFPFLLMWLALILVRQASTGQIQPGGQCMRKRNNLWAPSKLRVSWLLQSRRAKGHQVSQKESKLQQLHRGYKPCTGNAKHTDPKVIPALFRRKWALVIFQSCKNNARYWPWSRTNSYHFPTYRQKTKALQPVSSKKYPLLFWL